MEGTFKCHFLRCFPFSFLWLPCLHVAVALAWLLHAPACFVVKECCSVSLASLEVSYCNGINCKKILLPPTSYILTCTSMMCDLQGL